MARLLGHESAATTLNHYAAFFPTDLYDIASRLNAAARLTIAHQRAQEDRAAHTDADGDEISADDSGAWQETDYLLSSPENARRLLEAIGRLDASHSASSDTNEAPTTHRPERSEEE